MSTRILQNNLRWRVRHGRFVVATMLLSVVIGVPSLARFENATTDETLTLVSIFFTMFYGLHRAIGAFLMRVPDPDPSTNVTVPRKYVPAAVALLGVIIVGLAAIALVLTGLIAPLVDLGVFVNALFRYAGIAAFFTVLALVFTVSWGVGILVTNYWPRLVKELRAIFAQIENVVIQTEVRSHSHWIH